MTIEDNPFKRCTEWRGDHAAVVVNTVNYIDLLAKYEDTGLTPDEVSALHAQQEAEKNEPLTIPELLQMDIRPVWVEHNDGNGEWKLVDVVNKQLYGVCEDDEIIYCGTEYMAYRHPPKEAHNV